MSNKNYILSDRIHDYILSVTLRESDIQRRLREETARDPMSIMQIAPEQGQFMALLVQSMRATRAIEIGVFTGYSALSVAGALPPEGRLIACDINEHWTNMARRYWKEAGVEHKIDLRLAPALDTLNALIAEGHQETFDFAFIDADKVNYDAYYERCLSLLRPGGLIAIDNVLWSGDVADPAAQDEQTTALRALNNKLHHDERVSISLLPLSDGLTLALKRG